jgi:hypothetical protein
MTDEWFTLDDFPGYVLMGHPWKAVANCHTTDATPQEANLNAELICRAVNEMREREKAT